MSVINKNPVINQIIQNMDSKEFDFLKNVMNTKQEKEFVVFSDLPATNDICLAIFQLPFKTPLRGILWNEDDDKYYLINVFNGQRVEIYHIVDNKAEKVQEECSLLEIRLYILAREGGGGGGSITPAQLADLMEGSTETIAELNEKGDKVRVDLHAKRVDISAPDTATSGTLTDEQLAALHESTNSYIVFNNEKYYLNDNGHISGYLGYSHIGYENSNFIVKNITITESTLGWVLSTQEIGSGSGGDSEIINLVGTFGTGTDITITTPNIYTELVNFITTKGKYPFIKLTISPEGAEGGNAVMSFLLNIVGTNDNVSFQIGGTKLINSTNNVDVYDVAIELDTTGYKKAKLDVYQLIKDAEGVDFAVVLTPLNPELTSFSITSNNFAEEIKNYIDTNNRMPKAAGIVVAGDDKYLCLATQIDLEDDGVVKIGVSRVDKQTFGKIELHLDITMEPGHSGTTEGQSVSSGNTTYLQAYRIVSEAEQVVGGINVPTITGSDLNACFGAMSTGAVGVIKDTLNGREYVVVNAKQYKNNQAIQIRYENKDVVYYLGPDKDVVIEILTGSEIIEVHSAADLPTSANTDGTVKIVICDNGLLPAVVDQFAGYIYEELEA